MNIGTHILNNIMKFGGHCRAVTAVSSTNGHPITPEDVVASPSGMGTIAGEYISASLMLENNVTATLLQHRFNEIAPTGHTFEIYGTEGRIFYQGHEAAWLLPNPHTRPGGKQDSWESLEPVFPAHYNENGRSDVNDYWFVEEYVQALDDKRDHECSGSEAIHALEIIMGIFEFSLQTIFVSLGLDIATPKNSESENMKSTIVALIWGSMSLGLISPLIGGVIADNIGMEYTIMYSGILILLSSVCLVFLKIRL